MSSLTRARSLRKPAGPTSLPPRERPKESSSSSQDQPNRNVSPSRLPMKPASRGARPPPTSMANTTNTASTSSNSAATGPARSTSGRLNRPGSASSTASSVANGPRRSMSLGKKPSPKITEQQTQGNAGARKDTTRYPPLSAATRPQSLVMRPTSAGSTTAIGARRTTPTATATSTTTTTGAHARANSAAVTGTSTRTASAGTASAGTAQERKSRSRPPSRDMSSVAAPPGTPKRRAVSVDKPPTTPGANTTTTGAQTPRVNRGAFSTLQQQRLSPSKNGTPKTPAASSHAPPSPSKLPANVAASAETSRLQTELLQLHLLHRDATKVEAQFRDSAKRKLGTRFHALRESHREVADLEAAEAENDNIAALRRWVGAGSAGQLDEKIRALDEAISGVWAMSEPGGKYARVVRRFERWIERVMDLEEARENGTIGLLAPSGRQSFASSTGMEETLFIQDLDEAWGEDCTAMGRKLEGWQGLLDDVGYPDQDTADGDGGRRESSLERMLDGARALVGDMLSELGAMEELRQGALAREEEWIGGMNCDEDEGMRAGAVWRGM